MMKRRAWNDECGAFAVMFALIFIVLVGFAALAVDVGYWYASKRQLQTAADVAAMAGCQELAHAQSNLAIWSTVEDYAARNFTRPVTLSNCTVVAPSANGLSDIGSNYVKVTVNSDSPAFLSRVFGRNRVQIKAQSVARIGYATGARNPVPWGLPSLRATRVMVSAGGGPERALSKISDDTWSGSLNSGSLGSMLVSAYNDQRLDPAYPDGVPEDAQGAGMIVRIPDEFPLVSLSTARLSGGTEFPGSVVYTSDSERVVVYATLGSALPAGQTLVVEHDKDKITMSKITATLYRAQFTPQTTLGLQASFTYNLRLQDGNKLLQEISPAGRYLTRRSTFPIKDIRIVPSCVTSTSAGPSQVTVQLNEYEYGRLYEMKVTGGAAEVGNFMAVDFGSLRHTPNWRDPQDPREYPAMPTAMSTNYYPYIEGTGSFNFVMHIGDAVWTNTGALSGPTTDKALSDRFGGEPSNFAGWEAAGKPSSKRLVLVPIVEKIQNTTGSSPLRITSFATFYITSDPNKDGDVSGRFVEYTAPSLDVVDTPPGPLAIEAVHLSAIGLDF